MKYYDGNKLLTQKDINKNKPEIFISTTNRSAGKTTYFNSYLVKKFLAKKEKFVLLYRYSYEVVGCAEKFFNDIEKLFFKGMKMEQKSLIKGDGIASLYLNEIHCGYAVSLNKSEQVKKLSSLMCDCSIILFDEFQSETNTYLPKEVDKFISIHTSLARGNSQQSRYLPVIMLSNFVSLINPYYVSLGISEKLKSDTNYLKGKGYVLEQIINESASEAQSNSIFNSAFDNNYTKFSANKIYLNDNYCFVEKVSKISRYILTFKIEGKNYAIKECATEGIMYCDDKPDMSFPTKITISTNEHNVNYVMLKSNSFLLTQLREYFELGCFRFKNLSCKKALFILLSY